MAVRWGNVPGLEFAWRLSDSVVHLSTGGSFTICQQYQVRPDTHSTGPLEGWYAGVNWPRFANPTLCSTCGLWGGVSEDFKFHSVPEPDAGLVASVPLKAIGSQFTKSG